MQINFKLLFRTIALNLSFITLLIFINYLTGYHDYRVFFSVSYLAVFALSFYLGQNKKNTKILLSLFIGFGAIYLVSSFVVMLVAGGLFDSIMVASFCSSLFSSISLTALLNKLYGIAKVYLTIVASTVAGLLANIFAFQLGDITRIMFIDKLYFLDTSILIFVFWNLLVGTVLAFGMSFKART